MADGSENATKQPAAADTIPRTPAATDAPERTKYLAGIYERSTQAGQENGSQVEHRSGGDSIADMAQAKLGQNLRPDLAEWTRDGKFGAAASVAEILKQSGAKFDSVVKTASATGEAQNVDVPLTVKSLEEQLQKQGWTQVKPGSQPQPNDVVVAFRDENKYSGHTGIVGEDGKVFFNNSRTGRWGESTVQHFTSDPTFKSVGYMRPPEK